MKTVQTRLERGSLEKAISILLDPGIYSPQTLAGLMTLFNASVPTGTRSMMCRGQVPQGANVDTPPCASSHTQPVLSLSIFLSFVQYPTATRNPTLADVKFLVRQSWWNNSLRPAHGR